MVNLITGRTSVSILVLLSAAGCARQDFGITPQADAGSIKQLVFLTRDGCANTATMRANLDDALRSLGLALDYRVIDVATLKDTDARGGYRTPTVLYKDRDLFGMTHSPVPQAPAT